MTATRAPVTARPLTHRPGLAPARLLRLELRHNAMLWMIPVAVALFWFFALRKTLAMPPLWALRAPSLQSGGLISFASPVVGAAAWMGSRESRRRTAGLVSTAARPWPGRMLATWAATTCWALAAYVACVAVVYGLTARQASWGGPLWWPAAVGVASMVALTALGFAAGALRPSRFTPPLAAIAIFFVIALSTELIHGSTSYWLVSPIVTGPWNIGPDPGIGTFYPYLPDLSIAQVMFLAGLTAAVLGALALPTGLGMRYLRRSAAAVTAAGLVAAGTAVALAGTGRLDAHGMIAIPALHDAANDRPLRYTPVCSHTAIPVCLNPAYASYLAGTAADLGPVLSQLAGLPGAPARISQAAGTYLQDSDYGFALRGPGSGVSGATRVYHFLLPVQLPGPTATADWLASQLRSGTAPGIVASVTGDGPGASQAQQAVTTAVLMVARVVPRLAPPASSGGGRGESGSRRVHGTRRGHGTPRGSYAVIGPGLEAAPGSPAYAAALRFAALPPATRHAWLTAHLVALRAGHVSLRELP